MKLQKNTVRNALIALMLGFLLTGCGLTVQQKASLAGFSGATREFAGMASSEFAQDRMDVIEMNTWRVKLGDETVMTNQMDGALTVARVKERVDAIGALQDYANLLEKLATGSKSAELKSAADSFTSSMAKVKGGNLNDKQLAAIGSAIEKVGGLVIDHMRAKAIRQVVLAADPQINELLALVKRDLSPNEEYWSLGYDHTVNALRSSAKIAEREWGTTNSSTIVVIREARTVADNDQARFRMMSGQITEVINKLSTAQEHLRLTLQAKEITTDRINEYIVQAQDCARIYEILRQK